MLIKITDYNTVKITNIKIQDAKNNIYGTVFFKWIEHTSKGDMESRTHRARIRKDINGYYYFNSYKLKIALN